MLTRTSFVAALNDAKDVNAHCAFIDAHAKQGDLVVLRSIFAEVCQRQPQSRVPVWAVGAILERIVESLALTEGYENALTALELAATVDLQIGLLRLRPAAVASKLVAAQPPSVIDELVGTLSDLETAALVMHESVMRRKLLPESRAVPHVVQRLKVANHPLAVLPVHLIELEEAALLPDYGVGTMASEIPFGPMVTEQCAPTNMIDGAIEVTESTSLDRGNLITAAVKNWVDESNGLVEARVFHISSTMYPWEQILRRLGLECFGAADELRCRENATARDVFTTLFSAASHGGAYNSGHFAAYGRLLTWQSLAGLAGSSAQASIHEIATDVQNSQWCVFDSANEWYYQVAWDIGIACVNPYTNEIAVLAATDTD